MKKNEKLINSVEKIVDKIMDEINIGKSKIFNISDRLRDEYEERKKEPDNVNYELFRVIEEVEKKRKIKI